MNFLALLFLFGALAAAVGLQQAIALYHEFA